MERLTHSRHLSISFVPILLGAKSDLGDACFPVRQDSGVYQVVGNGIDGQTCQGVNLQFADDVAAVGDDGVDGDEQLVSNLLVRHALNKADNDFLLALFYLCTHGTRVG